MGQTEVRTEENLSKGPVHKTRSDCRALGRLAPLPLAMEPTSRRVAIVTGAAQGIGLGIARRLAKDGLDLALFDLPQCGTMLEEAAADIRKESKARVVCVLGDVSVEEDVKRLVETAVAEFGGLHVVCSAGLLSHGQRLTYLLS